MLFNMQISAKNQNQEQLTRFFILGVTFCWILLAVWFL